MGIEKITDHVTRAVDRLVSQFQNSGFLKGTASVLAGEAQALEDGLWDMLQAIRSVAVATGTTLDSIGALVGTPVRGGKTDTQYRNRVNTQIIANRSSGDAVSIYAVARQGVIAWNVPNQPRIRENFPGVYEIAAEPRGSISNDDTDARELAVLLNGASSAGVRAIVISIQVAPALAFAFDGGTGLGFGAGDFTAAYDQ